jgi:hypothetical protein
LSPINNRWIQANPPYQLLYAIGGDYSDFVAGPANCIINVQASPVGGGQVQGAGVYANKSTIQVSAIPATGFAFVSWTENGMAVSESNPFNFVFSGYRSLVANFSSTVPFQIDSLAESSANEVTISWTGQSGYGYQLQYSEDLQGGDWQNLGGEQTVEAGSAPMNQNDLPPSGHDRRFYRVVRTLRP